MQKIISILFVVILFTACKQNVEEATSSEEIVIDSIETAIDTVQETAPVRSGKLAATATDEAEGKDGKIISFTYDNNTSTVSFELNGKQVVLTSKEKISDMPTANGRTYTNDELTFNDKDGIKITDKKGKIVFEEKQ